MGEYGGIFECLEDVWTSLGVLRRHVNYKLEFVLQSLREKRDHSPSQSFIHAVYEKQYTHHKKSKSKVRKLIVV